ncbi:TonB family protein [Phenylobacterium sp.]|uniref:TonB family protein n=1 Tax=Phenylobacterium sp. TaxID=1871053 RepID=UPI0035B44BC6
MRARARSWTGAATAASAAVHLAAFAALAAHRPALDIAEQPAVNVQLVRLAPPRAEQPAPASPRPKPAAPQAARKAPAPKTPAEPAKTGASEPPAAPPAPTPPLTARPSAMPAPPARAPALAAADPAEAYRRQVWSHLAAHPPRAQPGAGVTRVAFRLDGSGGLVSLRLARSSGRPAFDRACLAAVRAAAPFPSPPEGLTDADLAFEVPIRAPGEN